MKYLAGPLGLLLSGIYDLVGDYGITLIVLTVIVRLILFPLYANQIKHSTKMTEVQPKIQEIQRRYANDREQMNAKMMELYRDEKFNPMMGCLPLLIQMPIIIGLFSLLRNPTLYIDNEEMWIAAHEALLWIPDLSQPDPWILPVAAGIATFFSFSLTPQMPASDPTNQMAGAMKMMKYFFPIMIVWMGRGFPAGLTLYWFIGTLIQIVQTRVLTYLRKREKNKAGKKSG